MRFLGRVYCARRRRSRLRPRRPSMRERIVQISFIKIIIQANQPFANIIFADLLAQTYLTSRQGSISRQSLVYRIQPIVAEKTGVYFNQPQGKSGHGTTYSGEKRGKNHGFYRFRRFLGFFWKFLIFFINIFSFRFGRIVIAGGEVF